MTHESLLPYLLLPCSSLSSLLSVSLSLHLLLSVSQSLSCLSMSCYISASQCLPSHVSPRATVFLCLCAPFYNSLLTALYLSASLSFWFLLSHSRHTDVWLLCSEGPFRLGVHQHGMISPLSCVPC